MLVWNASCTWLAEPENSSTVRPLVDPTWKPCDCSHDVSVRQALASGVDIRRQPDAREARSHGDKRHVTLAEALAEDRVQVFGGSEVIEDHGASTCQSLGNAAGLSAVSMS